MPDVVILDIGMPLLNGLETTRQLLKHDPDFKVVETSGAFVATSGNQPYRTNARTKTALDKMAELRRLTFIILIFKRHSVASLRAAVAQQQNGALGAWPLVYTTVRDIRIPGA
jgi:CheY-like chemotaxis protein